MDASDLSRQRPTDEAVYDTVRVLEELAVRVSPQATPRDLRRGLETALANLVPASLGDLQDFASVGPAFYMEALRNSRSAVIGLTPDGTIVYANEAACALFGYRCAELLGGDLTMLSPDDRTTTYRKRLKGFWASGRRSRTINRGSADIDVRHKDGTVFPAEITLARADSLLVATVRDVSTEKILRTIIDNLPGGITLFDANLSMIACNDLFKELLEFPESLFIEGLPTLLDLARYNAGRGDYGDGDPEEQAKAVVQRAMKFEPHVMERTRPDGTVLEVRGTPLPAGGFVTIYTDVTERKLAEEKLRQALDEIEKNRQYLNSVIEHLPQGVTVIDENLDIQTFNSAFATMMDMPREILYPGAPFAETIRFNAKRGHYGPGDPDTQTEKRVALARHFNPHRFERTLPGGRVIEVRGTPMKGGGFVTTYTDVTEARRHAERLRETVRLINDILDHSALYVWALDEEGRFTFVQGTDRVLGYAPADLIGRHYGDTLADVVEGRGLPTGFGTREAFSQVVAEQIGKDGRRRWTSTTGHPLYDKSGKVIGYQGVSVDVTEKHIKDLQIQELLRRLEQAALHDPLTGLANRTKFNQRFDEELVRQRRSGKPLSLLVADLDHFKQINDTHGHLTGDQVLRAVAELLPSRLRAIDLVARFGGEEFVILLPETDPDGALQLAEEVRELIAGHPVGLNDAGESIWVTVSIGVATMQADDQRGFDELMEAADRAVYAAKDAGRNRVRVHQGALPMVG